MSQCYLDYDEIKHITIGLTTYCNAKCPMCARNPNARVLKNLPLEHMSLAKFKSVLPPELLGRLGYLSIAGEYGENTLNPDFLAIVEYVMSSTTNETMLTVDTTGSTNGADYWRALGDIVKGRNATINFCIDGLKDTNHIYRIGVDWDKTMENVKAYLSTGARASWYFLVFRHNEHQIDEVRELAHSLGFQEFVLRRTRRFRGRKFLDVLDRKGEVLYQISPPSNEEYEHKVADVTEEKEVIRQYLDTTKITCRFQKKRTLAINHKGDVFPCCYFSGMSYALDNPLRGQWVDLLESAGGVESINGDVQKAIESSFYQEVVKSWSQDSIENGKLALCSFFCGEKTKYFKMNDAHDPETGELIELRGRV